MLQLKTIHKGTSNLLESLASKDNLQSFALQELLDLFERKYDQMNSFSVVKSLVYFADADLEPEPVSLVDVTWDDIKENLKNEVKEKF